GWVGAVTYTFSGMIVSETFYTNTHPGVMLLPWIIWSVARPARTIGSRILASSLFIGLALLAGDVFTTALALAASVLWILTEEKRASQAGVLTALAASTALGVLLALPQLVATLLWIPETH